MIHLLRSFLLGLTLLNSVGWAAAACNNPKNWDESPGSGVEMVVGYEKSRYAHEFQFFGRHFGNGGYPPTFTLEQLRALDEKTPKRNDRDFVMYFEPDGKGQWRLCRRESWPVIDKRYEKPDLLLYTRKNVAGNPRGLAMVETHYRDAAELFLYDSKGRLRETLYTSPDQSAGNVRCYRYDDKDREVLSISLSEEGPRKCPVGDPDPNEYWVRVRYVDTADGQAIEALHEFNWGKSSKGSFWNRDVRFYTGADLQRAATMKLADMKLYRGSGKVEGFADGRVTVTEIFIQRPDGSAVGGDGEDWSGPFYFTRPPVHLETLLSDPEEIFNLERRSVSGWGINQQIAFYQAGQRKPRDRFFAFGRLVYVHKQYDEALKLKRVINFGKFVKGKTYENHTEEDVRWKHFKLLKGRPPYYRVWDYDAHGKANLVAIGYNERYPWQSNFLDMPDVGPKLYTTIDGKKTWDWRTEKDFFKTYDFDPNASRAYPEVKWLNRAISK